MPYAAAWLGLLNSSTALDDRRVQINDSSAVGMNAHPAVCEIVGSLPGDLQNTVVFGAATMAGTRDAEASKALVDFLRTP